MGKIKLQEREEIPVEYTWDLESMYKNEKEWEKDCEKVKNLSEDIFNYKGKILSSSKVLLEVLKKRDELYRIVSKIFSYGNMKLDEDSRKSKSQILYNKGLGLYVYAQEKTSFIVPEILSAEEDELKGLLKESKKKDYVYINNILTIYSEARNMFFLLKKKPYWLKWVKSQTPLKIFFR